MKVASWLRALHAGDEVYWIDPDRDICSGNRKVLEIRTHSGRIEDVESIVVLVDTHGGITEAYPAELS